MSTPWMSTEGQDPPERQRVIDTALSARLCSEIEEDELRAAISGMSDKASGPDMVPVRMLKMLNIRKEGLGQSAPPGTHPGGGESPQQRIQRQAEENRAVVFRALLTLARQIVATGYWPPSIMEGECLSFYKKGDPRNMANYRGITLRSVIFNNNDETYVGSRRGAGDDAEPTRL